MKIHGIAIMLAIALPVSTACSAQPRSNEQTAREPDVIWVAPSTDQN
jgi:hypothetical protein